MKSELNHHYIGNSYGGNQDWFRTYWMRLGGCGAETACESSIYFAREFGMTELYPFDCKEINRKEYVDFAHIMEPYLSPRLTGINKLSIYVDGYSRYLRDAGEERIAVDAFGGDNPYKVAAEKVKLQIDAGLPIPFLTLRHKDKRYEEYVWHWYLVNGYEKTLEGLKVKAVTYSEYKWLDLRGLWNTGSKPTGGMIIYKVLGQQSIGHNHGNTIANAII